MVKIKKENITISFESEKLKALKKYMDKKNIDLQEEVSLGIKKLYDKYVPLAVREYIDESEFETEKLVTKDNKKENIKASENIEKIDEFKNNKIRENNQ